MRTGYWVGLFLACAVMVKAQSVPNSFNYQGVLRGGSGELLGTVQKIVDFRLYDLPANGNLLWGRTYMVQLDTNGLFNVELSDSGAPLSSAPSVPTPKPLSAVIAANPALYLGLKVSGADEIAPRQQLLSVPFAMMAGDVRSASAEFTVAGALTAEKGVTVTGLIEATAGVKVGDTTLTAKEQTLSVPGLAVAGAAVVSGNTTLAKDLTVSGNATLAKDLTVSGNTTLAKGLTVSDSATVSSLTVSGTTTLNGAVNGPVSLFSRNIPNPADWGTALSNADKSLLAPASSDGFIIVNLWFDFDISGDDDLNQIVAEFQFSGLPAVPVRKIEYGIEIKDVDGNHYAKKDVVTLPVLKGESVMFHPIAWHLLSASKIYQRSVFVPFGVNN